MRIYHGSLEKVTAPEIREPNRPLDYGSGFYTTTSEEQATTWVLRRMKEKKATHGYVNVYELMEEQVKALKTLVFDKPTESWVDFVMANRTQKGYIHDYDIVYGPVANDRVYVAFALYASGVLSKQNLIAELKTYKLVDQYLFHTEQSLQCLNFIEAKEVTL